MLHVGLNGPPISNGAHPILLGQTPLKDVDKNTTPLLTLRHHRLDKSLSSDHLESTLDTIWERLIQGFQTPPF